MTTGAAVVAIVTAVDAALTHCPLTCAVAVILPDAWAETVMLQLVPVTVAVPRDVAPLYTVTTAPLTQVPVIVVALTHIGDVTTGAAVVAIVTLFDTLLVQLLTVA